MANPCWLAVLAATVVGDGSFFVEIASDPHPPPIQIVQPVAHLQPVPPPPMAFQNVDSEWSTSMVIGIPLGVRFSKPLERSPVWFEGFAGLLVIFPSVSAGLRTELPMANDRDNCILIRPGVDLYLAANPYPGVDRNGFFAAMAADCDLVFRHRLSTRCHGDFGVKLGMGVPIIDRGGLFPIAALFGGFSY